MLKRFFRFAGLVTLVLGTACILFPQTMLWFLDRQAAQDIGFTHYLGTALIGFSVLNWYGARFADKPAIALVALTANFMSLALATVIDLIETASGMGAPGLPPVLALHLGFAAAFAWFIHDTRRKEHA